MQFFGLIYDSRQTKDWNSGKPSTMQSGATELGPSELGPSELGPTDMGPVLSFKG